MRCWATSAARGTGLGEYITAYIIRTMRDGARISYLEISAKCGLCQSEIDCCC
jgi:hypothetical protein